MIKLFKNLGKKEFSILAFVVSLIVCQVYLDLTLPDYMSEITTLIQSSGEMSNVLIAGGKMISCAVGSMVLSVIVAISSARVAANFSYITRDKVFKKVMSFSPEEVNGFSTSSLITRTTNDITQVQLLIVMGAQMLIKAPITAVWAIAKISSNADVSFTLATVSSVAILVVIIGLLLALAIPRFKKVQKLTDNVNKVAKQKLDGLSVVRAYNAEDYEEKKFRKVNNEITQNNLFIGRTTSFFMPFIQAIMNGLNLTIYLLGAALISSAEIVDKADIFSNMIVFSSYAMQIIMAFIMLCFVFMLYPRASVSAGRINEILDTNLSITEGKETKGLDGLIGEIEFKNVSFKYPGAEEYVLENLNFTAKNGEVVAFIGSTGAGKSSVVNLIPRFYDVTDGEVLVNGINVKEYTKNSLSSLIGYVSQKAVLFSGSVRSNVAFGDNPNNENDDNLQKAVEIAQAKDFVENLDEKYESRIAQGGSNLSGGQKQRVSISRAINRNAQILIFDDSFSALDYKTDKKLRDTLNKECGNTTRLIIGQRVGTIKDADKIIVLDDGKIVGMGSHKELLNECSVYKEIALSQLSEEELNNG